jgi:hypothetical protein
MGSGTGGRISQSWSAQVVACPRARRTATATASASNPNITASGGTAAATASRRVAWEASAGSPASDALMSARTSSGSRKKSPLMLADWISPSRARRSATTSCPPGTLYSPWRLDAEGCRMWDMPTILAIHFTIVDRRMGGPGNEEGTPSGVPSLLGVKTYFLPKFLKRALKRSTRPAESMMRCLPV